MPVDEETINIYGIYDDETPLVAKIDTEKDEFTIAGGQKVGTHETYGDITFYASSEDGSLTGYIVGNGYLVFDQIWWMTITLDEKVYRVSDYISSIMAPTNATMTFNQKDDNEKVVTITQRCFVAQSEDATEVTIWNFHNFAYGEVVDVTINPDKTFSIVGGEQALYMDSKGVAYYLWGYDGKYIDDVTGVVTDNSLVANIGLAYIDDNYYGAIFPEDVFTVTLDDGLAFNIPAAETGELVTVPAGLQTKDYPFTAKLYDVDHPKGGEYTSTVKIGWSGTDVYIQGLDKDLPEAWLKGSYNETSKEIVFPVTYTGQSAAGTPHFFAAYGRADGPKDLEIDYDADADTYDYGATVMIYKGSASTAYDYFYNGFFIGTKPVPTTAPAGLVTTDMPFAGTFYGEDSTSEDGEAKQGTVKVGRDGDDIYIQGLFEEDVPGGWLKGYFTTRQGNDDKTYTFAVFPMNQYVGNLSNGLSAYLTSLKQDGEEVYPVDVAFYYDATENYYMAVNPVILTRFKNSTRYTSYYTAGLTIGNAPAGISTLKADAEKKTGAWYTVDGLRVAQPTQKGLYIRNGRKFVIR